MIVADAFEDLGGKYATESFQAMPGSELKFGFSRGKPVATGCGGRVH